MKNSNKTTIWLMIKTVFFYYMFELGVWLMKLSFSIAIIAFVIGVLAENLHPIFFLYVPLSIFIPGGVLALVGGYYSLDNGIDALDKFHISTYR